MTKYEPIMKALLEPFAPNEIEWKVQQSGMGNNGIWAKVVAYVDARAAQNRLDKIVGIENWKVSYRFESVTMQAFKDNEPSGTFVITGVVCSLSLRFGDDWVSREDGAELTDIEAIKGGLSSAFKRTASAWGIGRYLYDLEEGWANIVEKGSPGARYAKDRKSGKEFYWTPPSLPAWALPPGTQVAKTAPKAAPPAAAAPAQPAAPLPKPNEAPRAETRGSVGAEILKLSVKLQVGEAELSEWAKEFSGGKPAKQMTLDELKKFRAALQAEMGRMT